MCFETKIYKITRKNASFCNLIISCSIFIILHSEITILIVAEMILYDTWNKFHNRRIK